MNRTKIVLAAILLAGWTAAAPVRAEEQPTRQAAEEACPHPERWRPTGEELHQILSDHRRWWEQNLSGPGRANLCRAYLQIADLAHAMLSQANLSGTTLAGANLSGAKLAYADLTGGLYALVSPPPDSDVAGIRVLWTVTFPDGEETGLVQLREVLQEAGLRDLEREATFAIEHGRAWHKIKAWQAAPIGALGGMFRVIAFDWTTAFGMRSERALFLIAGFWFLLILVYCWPILVRDPCQGKVSGIFLVRPADRIEASEFNGRPQIDNPAKVERLHRRGLRAIAYAAYFSLLSAFNIGFREINVGNWITRLQPREYTLQALGWVRVVAGAQSLLSVYLLAIWLLTTFGRPFQ